ncbi:related to endonuclease/exonuclease/phosphatase family protein [Cephalotrichum gorgonifer]|uniref:Related to endonuclease/exonuclease/phosphatase family protein n=1 Tax=Cephalotrichum gorgonifer TaxID=2041049 RepID=A0AAE8MTW1_9PEZI|nr:related to endonuclease/exonuclease/phosphatase family protein [Cephalotrichum gorgonifer]
MKIVDIPVLSTILPLRLITLNIRYDNPNRDRNEEPWSRRLPKLVASLRFLTSHNPNAFICHQEVLHSQLLGLSRELGPEWSHIGIGRDGGDGGEFSPVFYRPGTWRLEKERTAWLSPTPDVPSRGWDAVLNRIVTMGLFAHRSTGARVVVMSTHFDHIGVQARKESAKLILEFVREWRQGSSSKKPLAVLLGGDFNSTPEDEGYKTMTAPKSGMLDVRELVDADRRYGNELTYTSFGNEKPKRIDFLFVTSDLAIDVSEYGVLPNRFDDGVYISDHRPVVVDLEIPMCRNR